MTKSKKPVEKDLSESRYFRVIADRFDWNVKPRVTICYLKDTIMYGTRDCIAAGLAIGAIELIEKPEGSRVGERGVVHLVD